MTNVKQAQRAVTARTGDAMDVDAFTKGSSKGAPKGCGKHKDSEVVCWSRRRATELPTAARNRRTTTKDSRSVRRKATAKEKAVRRSSRASATSVARQVTCRKIANPKKRVHPRGDEGLAETWCVDMASTDLNALEIGAVQLPEKDHKIRVGIDPCAAMTVFPKTVADDHPMLQTPGKVKSYRPASRKLLPDLGARKCRSSSKTGLSSVREPESGGHAQSSDGSVRDERHGTRRVLSKKRQRPQGVCVPRGQWYEAGARESERILRVARRACSIQSQYCEERHFRYVFLTFGAGTYRGHDGQGCKCRPPKLTVACSAVSPTEGAWLEHLVVVG